MAKENDLKGVIDVADFNDEDKLGEGKEMIDRLSKLIGIFEGLNLSANRADGDDLLGDAYEYLMRHCGYKAPRYPAGKPAAPSNLQLRCDIPRRILPESAHTDNGSEHGL